METLEAIYTRKSVRNFSNKEIEDEKIEKIYMDVPCKAIN